MNRTFVVTALTLASLAGVAFGQEGARTPVVPPPRTVQEDAERLAASQAEAARAAVSRAAQAAAAQAKLVPPTMVTIEFPGGTVTNYVEQLKLATKSPINVVVSPSVSEAVMSPVQLKEVPVDAAIMAIQTACGQGSYNWRIKPMEMLNGAGPVTNAFSVDGERRGPQLASGDSARGPRRVEVLALPSSDAGGAKPDVALAAVEAGLRAAQTKTSVPADVSFHKESGLLFVNGNPEQIDLVKQVLLALNARSTTEEMSGWIDVIKKARTMIGTSSPADFVRRFEELVSDSKARIDAEHEAKASIAALQIASDNLKHQLDQQRSQAAVDRRDLEVKHQADIADMKEQYKALDRRYREVLDQAATLEAKFKATRDNPPVDNVKR